MTHEVDRQLDLLRTSPDIRERLDASVHFEKRNGKSLEIPFVEKSERETLFRCGLEREPFVRHFPKLMKQRRDLRRRYDAEGRAIFFQLVNLQTHFLAAAAFHRKCRERDERFLADLRERQAEIGVAVEI